MAGWIDIAIAAIGSYSEGKAKDKRSDKQVKEDRLDNRLAAEEGRATLAYAAEMEDFYKQQDKSRKSKAFGNFSKWASPSTQAPEGQPYYKPEVPATNPGDRYKPLYETIISEYDFEPQRMPSNTRGGG